MSNKIVCPNCGHVLNEYRKPSPTADVIVEIGGKVLLIRRKNPPYGWAIPGGFIDYGESAENAAIREIHEEAGISVNNLRLFGVYSDPARDPRFHTLTVVFTATSNDEPHAGDDAADARLFSLDSLPTELAFDHGQIIDDYCASRNNVNR